VSGSFWTCDDHDFENVTFGVYPVILNVIYDGDVYPDRGFVIFSSLDFYFYYDGVDFYFYYDGVDFYFYYDGVDLYFYYDGVDCDFSICDFSFSFLCAYLYLFHRLCYRCLSLFHRLVSSHLNPWKTEAALKGRKKN